MSENRVLRRIFWLKKDEVTGDWRKLHNEENNDLAAYAVLCDSGHVARVGDGRGMYKVLMGKPEGKRPMGRPRRRWKNNIKMDFQEVGCGGVDWIELAHYRDRWWAFVNAVMNLRGP